MNVPRFVITTDSYFDGASHHADGPYGIFVHGEVIEKVVAGDPNISRDHFPEAYRQQGVETVRANFVMPGLVEAHCHLFLDGAELDFKRRKDYLAAPFEEMVGVAKKNLEQTADCGITLLREAGDIHGVNTRIKEESDGGSPIEVLSAGKAIRKAKRYGSFMAREVTDAESIVRVIREIAPSASQLKVLLTGIIDFEKGTMKGGPQFSLEETKLIVDTARELNLRTFAHCSGEDGLEIALEAGIDSIEHGFFMSRRILEGMARKGIAWIPTYSPVDFQLQRPELAGWNSETCDRLRAILENHDQHVALA
ncbi:MAG: amidohydrolase family protein, partial [Verrucomicrobiales bacterium]